MTAHNAKKSAHVLVGIGRFADPWHDFAGTGAAVAEALEALGMSARVLDFTADSLTEIDDADLVVVNAGCDRSVHQPLDYDWQRGVASLSRYVSRGGPVLALHAAAATLREVPEWRSWIGGAWIDGVSMHPPMEVARVDLEGTYLVATGLSSFETLDEMYCFLELDEGTEVFASYTDSVNRSHPLAWTHRSQGTRVIYDALGHDPQAYTNAGRRSLLAAEVAWLTAGADEGSR